jgi:hypothetical protein
LALRDLLEEVRRLAVFAPALVDQAGGVLQELWPFAVRLRRSGWR